MYRKSRTFRCHKLIRNDVQLIIVQHNISFNEQARRIVQGHRFVDKLCRLQKGVLVLRTRWESAGIRNRLAVPTFDAKSPAANISHY